jgi:hypothetical protein
VRVISRRLIVTMGLTQLSPSPKGGIKEEGYMNENSDNERGLYQKYIINKANGEALDPNFYAIVLRIDGGRYVDACRNGALAFAAEVRSLNEQLAHDIYQKVYELIREEVRRERSHPK